MRILFIDPVTPKPYDSATLENEPLGGSESTVIRLAEEFGKRGHEVLVVQHNRGERSGRYAGFGSGNEFKPTHVIVMRAPNALRQAKKQFPNAKLYLYCHDIFGGEAWKDGFQAMVDTQAVPILVSLWHQTQMYDHIKALNLDVSIPSRKIYNPIADDLKHDPDVQVDTNKLVFFSSPHKGLDNTLKIFSRFKDFAELRDMKLYVANPGYFPDHELKGTENVVNLGALPHPKVIEHVRSAFAVLHLNSVFPETFGIVYAEANAVGTPFLSHRLGAVPEVVDHPAELIDVNDPKAVIDRLIQWKTLSRPKVRGESRFRMVRIVREWLELLAL